MGWTVTLSGSGVGIRVRPKNLIRADGDEIMEKLRYLSSPPFTAVRDGRRIPLRAVTQLDGFGRLGIILAYSDHEPDALRPLAVEYFGEDDVDIVEFASDATFVESNVMWGFLTTPVHSGRVFRNKRFGVLVPPKMLDEARAMVQAGLARFSGELEPYGSFGQTAEVIELLGVESWRKLEGMETPADD